MESYKGLPITIDNYGNSLLFSNSSNYRNSSNYGNCGNSYKLPAPRSYHSYRPARISRPLKRLVGAAPQAALAPAGGALRVPALCGAVWPAPAALDAPAAPRARRALMRPRGEPPVAHPEGASP